jgi:dTDP-4-amino-4,6-dideoxygalactose transaminase
MTQLDTLPFSYFKEILPALFGGFPGASKTPSAHELAKLILPPDQIADTKTYVRLRSGIAELLSNLNLQNKRVIFPSFACHSVTKAAEKIGARITRLPYPLTAAKLKKIDLSKVSAVFVVHAFGIPADGQKSNMEEIAKLCREHKIILIEDCAHSLDYPQVGAWGDYALFHFTKRLANLHGGLVISKKKKLKNDPQANSRFPIKDFIRLILQTATLRLTLNFVRKRQGLHTETSAAHQIPKSGYKSTHPFARRLFKIELKRHQQESKIRENLRKKYLEKLPSNWTPLCKDHKVDTLQFPVVTPKNLCRDKTLLKLRKRGIMANRIWYNTDDPIAKKILVLPLHASMTKKDVEKICQSLPE